MKDEVFYDAVSRCLPVTTARACENCPLVNVNGCKFELMAESVIRHEETKKNKEG